MDFTAVVAVSRSIPDISVRSSRQPQYVVCADD